MSEPDAKRQRAWLVSLVAGSIVGGYKANVETSGRPWHEVHPHAMADAERIVRASGYDHCESSALVAHASEEDIRNAELVDLVSWLRAVNNGMDQPDPALDELLTIIETRKPHRDVP